MGQFCAYHNPNPLTRHEYPYLLDVQNNLLNELKTTVVIPLMFLSESRSMMAF
ncbi:CcdB protein [Pseudidiomarina maritima]|uniref:Toxin CcdB n=1 Tax=Pseudidiomarina maritima TaxID=519453 RepID=A0A1I6HQI3_9GAMM|nr:CcdB protein [Pseudidiomarina maritima]